MELLNYYNNVMDMSDEERKGEKTKLNKEIDELNSYRPLLKNEWEIKDYIDIKIDVLAKLHIILKIQNHG